MNEAMKHDFVERVNREMDADLPPLEGSTGELLAQCCWKPTRPG